MFQIGGNEKFAKVIEFLRCQIHQDTVFLYVNSVFSPNPDELINDLTLESMGSWWSITHHRWHGVERCTSWKLTSANMEKPCTTNF
ncbi:hypothetical protein BRADI_1g46420v3 [Brachypodium distachyon]|uniref:Ubiquitin-like protein ATG12 n=1 Tax=Brachypodium distachyon TaxID=15368 RepID=A0A0Q3JMY0_BRADI|nr:hypothetical protein BRADI_1g46420v3 [Brachypodium distachyon]